MTFTEAAIEVLRREGKPLHFKKIAEIAVRESLLDHVGKIPDEVMGGQLANHCRLPRADRHVVVVQAGTFALEEWGIDEDPAGLDGLVEPPPVIDLAYRGRERHPVPSRELGRVRGEGRARRREEGEERRRRFPPPAEVAFEILAGAERPMSLTEIAAQGAERLLMPDAFVRDAGALAAALAEDNRRREAGGRKALFALEGESVSLAAQPEPGERVAAQAAVAVSRAPVTPAEARRAGLAALRRRLRECDGATAEWVGARLLERQGLRELKVAKRGRDHVVFTGRRRMGLAEVRHCVRVVRSGGEISRRDIADLRRDISNYGAQIGVLLCAADAGREARAEATAPGQLPVLLLAGEAFAEALADASVGCRQVVVPEVDEEFFRQAAEEAAEEEAARRARREDRERRERPERDDRREARREGGEPEVVAAEGSGEATAAAPPDVAAGAEGDASGGEPDEPEGPEGDEDEREEAEGVPGAAAEGATSAREGGRRRRRRRRRRGRGERREGPAASGEAAAPPAAAPPPTSGGEGGGESA
ncbi:MAG TPA: HTH domain-containing protein [Anaeromyxobacteraceae bacterium]